MSVKELLLGCGAKRIKEISLNPDATEWRNLVTLDMNPDHKPDVVWDLNNLPLPFQDNEFDEIHAYEVMEHVGQQGDWKFFFDQWSDLWRILKPDGQFYGTSPLWSREWAWGDPGHTRVVQAEQFVFLDQSEYTKQIGKTPMTDYRFCYKADFKLLYAQPMPIPGTDRPVRFAYILQAIKPSRIVPEQKELPL